MSVFYQVVSECRSHAAPIYSIKKSPLTYYLLKAGKIKTFEFPPRRLVTSLELNIHLDQKTEVLKELDMQHLGPLDT